MHPALFVLTLLPPTPAAQHVPAPPCKPSVTMAKADRAVRMRPLGEMPPASQLLAVYRDVGGCTEPAVVRLRVGAPGVRQEP